MRKGVRYWVLGNWFLLISILLIFLSGCTLLGGKTVIIEKGTKALELSFVKDMPPYQTYEDTRNAIAVYMKNVGATNIKEGIYSLNAPTQYIDVPESFGTFQLQGKQEGLPYGEEYQQQFLTQTKNLAAQQQKIPLDISFTACFPYKTHAGFSTCIDTDPTGIDKRKSCSTLYISTSGGQGGPVVIKKIEPKMEIQKEGVIPVFDIYLRNEGGGIITSQKNFGDYCKGKQLPRQEIELSVLLADEKLECSKEKLELSSKESRINCRGREYSRKEGTFNALLVIDANYGYVQTVAKQINVVKK